MRTATTCLAAFLALASTTALAQDKAATSPADDRLVVKAHLKGGAFSPTDGMINLTAHTDEPERRSLSGRILVTVDGDMEATISAERLDVPGVIEVSGWGRNRKGGLVAYRKSLRGEIDLGEIVFGDDAPVLVSGRAVTPRNRAIGGNSWIRVRLARPSGAGIVLEEMRAQTGEDGRFVVYGDARDVKGLVVETAGCWKTAHPPTFTAGAKDVEVVADSAVGVSGKLELPPGLCIDDLVMELAGPPDGTVDATVSTPTSLHHRSPDCLEFPASASFQIQGVQAGQYDLRVKFRGAHRVLARLADVKIDDETTFLPTLKVIDPIRTVSVRVAAPDGSPAKDARLWVRDKGDRGAFREVKLDAKSSGEVVFVGEAAELAARAAGTDFARATTAQETTLTPAPTQSTSVTVALPEGAPTSSKSSDLRVAFEWRGPADAARASVEASTDDVDPRSTEKIEVGFPETGPAFAAISVPGWYGVMLRARRSSGRVEGWHGRDLGFFRFDGAKAASVPVKLSREEIERLLDWDFRPGSR